MNYFKILGPVFGLAAMLKPFICTLSPGMKTSGSLKLTAKTDLHGWCRLFCLAWLG